jgi:hypothetical protein
MSSESGNQPVLRRAHEIRAGDLLLVEESPREELFVSGGGWQLYALVDSVGYDERGRLTFQLAYLREDGGVLVESASFEPGEYVRAVRRTALMGRIGRHVGIYAGIAAEFAHEVEKRRAHLRRQNPILGSARDESDAPDT